MQTQSQLGSLPYLFPLRFQYTPPIPVRRHTVSRTAGGIVIQQAPVLFTEDRIISWRLEAVLESVKDEVKAFYNDPLSPELDFIGHNEPLITYKVRCLVLDEIKIKASLWYLSGSFQITG